MQLIHPLKITHKSLTDEPAAEVDGNRSQPPKNCGTPLASQEPMLQARNSSQEQAPRLWPEFQESIVGTESIIGKGCDLTWGS